MTAVINAAHASGARVVLTVQSFAWSSAGVARQKALLGSSGNRANLARQIAAAVRDRGADGVNLDFEPIVATYADEFTALVRAVRSELNKVHAGLPADVRHDRLDRQLPDREGAPRPAARTPSWSWATTTAAASSNPVGSVAPIGGPTYDIARHGRGLPRPHPRLEGHPRRAVLRPRLVDRRPRRSTPGTSRAPSTAPRRPSSTARPASTPPTTASSATRSRASPGPPTSARTAPRSTAASTPWRQLYYDDATALGLKYDLVNRDEPARRRDLGARLRRDPARAVRGAQGQVHHRQGPAGHHRVVAQRRRSSRPTATAGWTRVTGSARP